MADLPFKSFMTLRLITVYVFTIKTLIDGSVFKLTSIKKINPSLS